MKLSQILFKQHIGRQIRGCWYAQGKRNPMETNAEKILVAKGIKVVDPEEIVNPKRKRDFNFKDCNFLKSRPVAMDDSHPDWKEAQCLVYEDHNLLIEGLAQAQQITKTVVFANEFPKDMQALIQKQNITAQINKLVKRIIETSVIYDAYQELLPKIKDPQRPAFNFPRLMGITDVRKISNLSKKLIQLCDCISGPQIANSRSILDNTFLCLPFEKEFELFKFSLTMDTMLMSEAPLRPLKKVTNDEILSLPNLHPLHHTIGLKKLHIYKFDDVYPIVSGYHKKYIHTIFIYYDKTTVKNTTELEVEETQIFGRAMIKAFTAAAAMARQRFGCNVTQLPEPVTVQCIHSDGKTFYFSIYQLNTLNVDGEEGTKNYCWTMPKLDLYEIGGYQDGKPVLEGYNPEVFKRILAFYNNN